MIFSVTLLFSVIGSYRVKGQYSEVFLPNDAYSSTTPCACDLTSNQWDNNCCCDPDRNSTDIEIADCFQGFFGGNSTIEMENMCRSNQEFTPDWFPYLCIQFLNTPDLGLYFVSQGNGFAYSYASPTSKSVCTSTNYTSGKPICVPSSGPIDLKLPQKVNGHCTGYAVRYLNNTEAICDTVVNSEVCQSATILDASTYNTAVLDGNGSTVVPTVNYIYASANDPTYVKTNTGTPNPTASLFTPTPPSTNPCSTNCAYAPPQAIDTECQNAVAEVRYVFTWTAGTIAAMDITIVLVNASMTSNILTANPLSRQNFILAQKFSTTFTAQGATTQTRSGNPGYEFGLPVISGAVTSSNTVDTSAMSQLKTWASSTTGLCADSTTAAPSFGYDVISGCAIVTSLSDCPSIRALVEDEQRQLLQNASLISRFGNPNVSTTSQDWWIQTSGNLSDLTETTTVNGICQGVPSVANIQFLWAKTGELGGNDVREIVGAEISWTRENWTISSRGDLTTYVIYSSVTFTQIPAVPGTPSTTYELNRNDTCRKDATCWPELFLPIQAEFFFLFDLSTADTLRMYNYRWAVTVTFFSLAAVVLPVNWRKIGRYIKQGLPL